MQTQRRLLKEQSDQSSLTRVYIICRSSGVLLLSHGGLAKPSLLHLQNKDVPIAEINIIFLFILSFSFQQRLVTGRGVNALGSNFRTTLFVETNLSICMLILKLYLNSRSSDAPLFLIRLSVIFCFSQLYRIHPFFLLGRNINIKFIHFPYVVKMFV